MIKKIFVIFILLVTLSSSTFACKCPREIANIFTTITNYIVNENVVPATVNATTKLIPQLEENISIINKENKELERLLKLEREKSIEADRLVFLLNKTLELNNLE